MGDCPVEFNSVAIRRRVTNGLNRRFETAKSRSQFPQSLPDGGGLPARSIDAIAGLVDDEDGALA
jgi:hypothetical protein